MGNWLMVHCHWILRCFCLCDLVGKSWCSLSNKLICNDYISIELWTKQASVVHLFVVTAACMRVSCGDKCINICSKKINFIFSILLQYVVIWHNVYKYSSEIKARNLSFTYDDSLFKTLHLFAWIFIHCLHLAFTQYCFHFILIHGKASVLV